MRGRDKKDREFGVLLLLEQAVRQTYADRRSSAIQPLQWSILRYLHVQPHPKRQLRHLAEHLNLTRAPVARAVKTLESRQFVVQVDGVTDMRTKTIDLTAAGTEVLTSDPMRAAARRLALLPETDLACFQDVIEQVFLSASTR